MSPSLHVDAQVVLIIKTNMIWTLMLVKKSTITHVTKNVTIEMNGITHKDLTDVITNVIVMVSEPVTPKDGVKVMPEVKITVVNSQKKDTTSSMITLVTDNVTLLLSSLNVTIKVNNSNSLVKNNA